MRNQILLVGVDDRLIQFALELDKQATKQLGKDIRINSGVRTFEDAVRLWNDKQAYDAWVKNGKKGTPPNSQVYPVSNPYTSPTDSHRSKMAFDTDYKNWGSQLVQFHNIVSSLLSKPKWKEIKWGIEFNDPVHFEVRDWRKKAYIAKLPNKKLMFGLFTILILGSSAGTIYYYRNHPKIKPYLEKIKKGIK